MFTPSVSLRRSPRLSALPRSKKRKLGVLNKKSSTGQKTSGKAEHVSTRFAAVLIDIEGTTTPISFVRSVLFPYADKALENFLDTTYSSPETQQDIADLTSRALEDAKQGAPPIPPSISKPEHIKAIAANVRWQMANDMKTTALKRLQGHIWASGYQSGDLHGEIFPDVAPCLKEWHKAGLKLYVYSSGSVQAQQLLFGHSTSGDMRPLFSGYFDTTTGHKTERDSYVAIAREVGCSSEKILFLTDIYAEAEAALAAGMKAVIMRRPGNARALAKGPLSIPIAPSFFLSAQVVSD